MQFSLFDWLANASILIKIIMAVLFIMSLLSWSLVFSKYWQLKNVKVKDYIKTLEFEPNLQAIYQKLSNTNPTDAESVVYTAILSFKQYQHQPLDIQLQNTERSICINLDDKFSLFGKNINILASIANIAPYIGLLGTVIGIMHTFLNLGDASGIQQIAPSIAESLIVTAMGLIVAIPASMAYSYFADKLNDIQTSFYTLKDRIINLLTLN
jgi:biopolymer transport protein TolQ